MGALIIVFLLVMLGLAIADSFKIPSSTLDMDDLIRVVREHDLKKRYRRVKMISPTLALCEEKQKIGVFCLEKNELVIPIEYDELSDFEIEEKTEGDFGLYSSGRHYSAKKKKQKMFLLCIKF